MAKYMHKKWGIEIERDAKNVYTSNAIPLNDPNPIVQRNCKFLEENKLRLRYRTARAWVAKWFLDNKEIDRVEDVARDTAGIGVPDYAMEWRFVNREPAEQRIAEVAEDVIGKAPSIRHADTTNANERRILSLVYTKAADVAAKSQWAVPSQIVFEPHVGLAGTVDIVSATGDGYVNLVMWNGGVTVCDPDAKFIRFGRAPIDFVPETPYWKYALQLNLMQFLIERMLILPRDTKFRRMIFRVGSEGVKTIPVPDMGKTVRDMIIYAYNAYNDVIPF